jgi:hypothetical protein
VSVWNGDRQMTEVFEKIIDESIKLEQNVAALYTIFSVTFVEDSDFWKELISEEENHASLIGEGRKSFLLRGEFPSQLVAPKLEMLIAANKKVVSLIKEYSENPPSKETAFKVAFELENSAGEIHFQKAMENPPDSELMAIFQHLNKDDRDHASKIRKYAGYKSIQI